MSDQLKDLTDSWLDLRWALDPVDASSQGLTQFDNRFGNFTEPDVKSHCAALKSLSGALEEYEAPTLADEIDRTAILSDVRVAVHRFTQERPHCRNPEFWLTHILEGLYLLLARPDRTAAERAAGLAGRLQAVPRLLADARATLTECPRVFVDTALLMLDGAVDLVERSIQAAGSDLPAGAGDLALAAVLEYREFLASVGKDAPEDGFAVGEDAFNFRLHHEHMLRATAPEIWRYGVHLVDEVEAEIRALAAEIDPDTPWHTLIDRLRDEHPEAGQLVGCYREEMERARDLVLRHDLAPVTEVPLDVVETPPFLRPLIPYAAYQAPGVYSRNKRALFYVTPPDESLSEEEADFVLRDHCFHELAATAAHEAWPGHHLHLSLAQSLERTPRRFVWSALTVEGWALYCEEMLGEFGFYRTPVEKLFQKVQLLWRAVRILADVGLHTRGMTMDAAVDLMVERGRLERANAESEVRRYCAYPAYQLCYAVGRRELLSLRADWERQGGERPLRQFHEEVLSYGGLPVSLMRWGMGLDR